MIAQLPNDTHDREQLLFDFERIRKECPHFLAWLEESVAATIDIVCSQDGTFLVRETGALDTLRQISGTITNPPQSGASANAQVSGMAM